MSILRPEMTPERIEQINMLISENPDWHRTKLSKELCNLWNWKGENGQIKDISCRDMLRALDAAGKISLPKKLKNPRVKGNVEHIVPMLHDMSSVTVSLAELTPLVVQTVIEKYELMEFKSYIEQFHYLGYDRNIGENIKYFVYDKHGRRLACLMFGSAAWSCKPRDEFIGWSKIGRHASALRYMTNNSRFLIFPWVQVSHLASHILSIISRRISSDWIVKYGHPVYMLETFVQRDKFKGTCYKAANWICVGQTTGRGRNSKTNIGQLPVKDIYIYPLHKRFREKLKDSGIQTQD